MEHTYNANKTKGVNLVVGKMVRNNGVLALHSLGEIAQSLTTNVSQNKRPMLCPKIS
jgi:hypothetical protein